MKYQDLQEKAKKAAQIWSHYKKKETWKKLFEKNKQTILQKTTGLKNKKQEARHFYEERKQEVKKIINENKKQLEKVLPSKEQFAKEGNSLLYRTMLELEKIPLDWVDDIGKYTGRSAYRFNRKRRNIALRQIKLAFPHWPKEKIAKVAKESFENLGETIFETIKKADFEKNIQQYVQPKNLEVAEQIKKSGAIIIAGHFANWEFSSFALEMVGLKGIYLAKTNNPIVQKFTERYRKTAGWEIIPVGTQALPAKIVKTIKSKKIIYTMLDTDPVNAKTLLCDFFGKKTNVSSFPARLAKKYQIPVVSFFNHRTKTKKHIFSFEILSAPPYNTKQTEQELSQTYTNAIEKHIHKYPSQWRWAMPRWKKDL